jgi:uncharacterized protein involved in response to NO
MAASPPLDMTRPRKAPSGFALFASGFRPFFLLAGAYGALALLAWLAHLDGYIQLGGPAGAMAWHGHEMLFGFGTAVLGGFLLTAVPNWTGGSALHGGPLMLLALAWGAGRIALWAAAAIPASLTAVMDLVFLPSLALAVAPALVSAGNNRNLLFLIVPTALFGCNLAYHLDALGLVADAAFRGQIVALDLFALMIAIVGGRIVPAFTRNALGLAGDQSGIPARPRIDAAAIVSVALVVLADAGGGTDPVIGALALAAAVLNAVRLAGWRTGRTLDKPILAVLHLGYGWLIAGLFAKGIAASWGVIPATTALHALGIGAVGTMTLAVMSRAALGHTGRPLVAAPLTIAAYLLVSAAALIRILVPPLMPELGPGAFAVSGLLWSLAFLCFLVVYAPILIRPRRDGQPG